jgi:uncharacterized BrkB/YihY/UPF0761 family membrane protein
MLYEFFRLLGDISLCILPGTIICLVLLLVHEVSNISKNNHYRKFLKYSFCLTMTIVIIFCAMIVIIISIYQIGQIWEQYEIEKNETVEPYVSEATYFAVTFIWEVVGATLIFLFWKNVYFRQIIPGEGNIRTRLKNYIGLKKK